MCFQEQEHVFFCIFLPGVLNCKLFWFCTERVTQCGWELFLESDFALVLVKDLHRRLCMSHHSRECLPPVGTQTQATLKWTAAAAEQGPFLEFYLQIEYFWTVKSPLWSSALQLQSNNCVSSCRHGESLEDSKRHSSPLLVCLWVWGGRMGLSLRILTPWKEALNV